MKRLVILFLLMCSVVFGDYDNSSVDVNAGGYGRSVENTSRFSGTGQLGWNEQYPILTAGILQEVTFAFYNTTPTASDSVIAILSESGGTYTVEKAFRSAQLLTDAGTDGINSRTYDLSSLNLAVEPGWYLAIGTTFSAGTVGYSSDSTAVVTRNTASGLAAIVDDFTFAVVTTALNRILKIDAVVSTNETIIQDITAGYGSGDTVNIPYYDDQGQYIVIEDIVVPDTEDLEISFRYTDPTTGVDTAATTNPLVISFVDDATDNKITMDNFATSKDLTDQFGKKITAHIWTDPVNDLIEVLFVCYEDGQGPQGDKDIKHISLMDRVPIALADFPLRRIAFTNTGAGASVASVVSCRKPVLAVGDSFVSTYGTETSLTRVGLEMAKATAFTEQRYVINGGESGGSVTRDSAGGSTTAIRTRWNDDDQDLVGFRDVVTVFVNGPGLNDFAPFIDGSSTATEISSLSERINGDIARMAGDNLSDFLATTNDKVSNDTVLCEMIPYEAHTGQERINEQTVQESINANLRELSYELQIPIALTYRYYLHNGGYSDAGTHPDAAGITWITDQIVSAYENNSISKNPHARSRSTYGIRRSIYP